MSPARVSRLLPAHHPPIEKVVRLLTCTITQVTPREQSLQIGLIVLATTAAHSVDSSRMEALPRSELIGKPPPVEHKL